MSEEVNCAGSDAIDERLAALYPEQEGLYYRTLLPYELGGNDPLDSIGIWRSEKGQPHWHYVTYGFSELYEKESEEQEISGYGFELSFRLRRGGEEQPPVWPVNLLQNLARYVFSSGNVLGPGHYLDCNGPVALDEDTQLCALSFAVDPELGEIDTPNGHLVFLQAIAVTEEEMNAHMCWSGEKFCRLLRQYLPLGITDLSRRSLLQQPDFRAAWEAGVAEDGSSTGFLYVTELETMLKNGRLQLRLGADHTETLARMLQARVGKGRSLFLQGDKQAIAIEMGEKPHFAEGEGGLMALTLNNAALQELCQLLRPSAGLYPLETMPLTLELARTEVKDQQGRVLRVIG